MFLNDFDNLRLADFDDLRLLLTDFNKLDRLSNWSRCGYKEWTRSSCQGQRFEEQLSVVSLSPANSDETSALLGLTFDDAGLGASDVEGGEGNEESELEKEGKELGGSMAVGFLLKLIGEGF